MAEGLRLLLIDDSAVERRLFEAYLHRAGRDDVALDHAATIEAGIAHLAAHAVDLVFLDNRIPPYESFAETAPKLRAAGFDGPIYAYSAAIDATPAFKNPEAHGATGCFDKLDFGAETLKAILEAVG